MIHYTEFNYKSISAKLVHTKKHVYLNQILTFDTETTTLYYINKKWVGFDYTKDKEFYKEIECTSFVYLWSFGYEEQVVYGRTIEEFKEFIDNLRQELVKRTKEQELEIIIYIHNLPYDINFLYNVFDFDKSFQRKPHKPMYCTSGYITFKDSYIYSNMSLSTISKNNKKYKKLDGEQFDYSKTRYPWTELNEYELEYSENDCLALWEYLTKEKKNYKGKINAMPLTNTSKVKRALTKKIKKENPELVYQCQKLVPYLQEFKDLLQLFMGGVTHLNAIYTGVCVEGVKSKDYTSDYPFQLLARKYPTSHFQRYEGYYEIDKNGNEKDNGYKNIMKDDNYLWYSWIDIYNFKSKNGFPYIPSHKCVEKSKCTYDNGRYYKGEHIKMLVTNIDYEIIKNNYHYEKIVITDLHLATCDYLDNSIRDFIIELYQNKTIYKDDESNIDLYMNSKNMFNAIYGLQVLQIIAPSVEWNDKEKVYKVQENFGDKEILELLQEQRTNKNQITVFSRGVWCTAYAREFLYRAIACVTNPIDSIYTDTDSLKYKDDEGVYNANFEKLNKEIDEMLRKALSKEQYEKCKPKNNKGVECQIGIMTDEKPYKEFKSFGAKKYCYSYADEPKHTYHLTVAGLSKNACEVIHRMNDFEIGKIFNYKTSGRTIAIYNNNQLPIVLEDGNIIDYPIGISLRPTTYKLGTEKKYTHFYTEQQKDYVIWNNGIFRKE